MGMYENVGGEKLTSKVRKGPEAVGQIGVGIGEDSDFGEKVRRPRCIKGNS